MMIKNKYNNKLKRKSRIIKRYAKDLWGNNMVGLRYKRRLNLRRLKTYFYRLKLKKLNEDSMMLTWKSKRYSPPVSSSKIREIKSKFMNLKEDLNEKKRRW